MNCSRPQLSLVYHSKLKRFHNEPAQVLDVGLVQIVTSLIASLSALTEFRQCFVGANHEVNVDAPFIVDQEVSTFLQSPLAQEAIRAELTDRRGWALLDGECRGRELLEVDIDAFFEICLPSLDHFLAYSQISLLLLLEPGHLGVH